MEKPLLLLALVPLTVGLGPDIRRDRIQKLGRDTQKDSSARLLGAHGRRRRVDHRKPTRMTFHAAARRPGYRPRPVHGPSVPFPAIKQQRPVSSP